MGLGSSLVGLRFRASISEVTWRRTKNYAASVEDGNPLYFDDQSPDGIIAPPMFAVAVTFPVIERIWDFVDGADFPFEILPTMVHYTEHLQFFRPIKPDERLKVQGRVAAVVPHRAGTQLVIRFDATDELGEQVFCEHIGAMMRGICCEDEGGGLDSLPCIPEHENDGDGSWESRIKIDTFRPYLYDGCSQIFFPIHTSPAFAAQVGLPGIILQGTATLAYAAREITNIEASGDPKALRTMACRFRGMVFPGTAITIQAKGRRSDKDGTHLHFIVLNGDGQIAVDKGYALINGH